MKNPQKVSKVSPLKLFLPIPLAFAFFLTVNAQPISTSKKVVYDSAKDSVAIEKPVVKAPAENTIKNQTDKDKIYSVIDKMPQFPGEEKELMNYIAKNLKYPVEAQLKEIQGIISVRCIVRKSGKVENASIIHGIDPTIDAEGIRIVNSLPDFIPAEKNGKKVSVYFTLPITFKLTGNNKTSNIIPLKNRVFVLDGNLLPKRYNISTINKNSILSVKDLKPDTDAQKAELIRKYGKRAENGVILLITKK